MTTRQSEDDRDGIFFATLFGAMTGTLIGSDITFVWWLALIEVAFGFSVHTYVNKQRNHAGSIMLAYVGTAVICVAASSFGIWLRN